MTGAQLRSTLCAWFLAGTAACGGDVRAGSGWAGTVETLANGVVLVSNPETGIWAGGEEWRLVEELRLGSVEEEGPELFGRVGALAVDELGNIYVADAAAFEIRVFDSTGRHLRSIGRKGGGPGEFEQIIGMAWGPDGKLWVMDTGNSRFAVFDPTGPFVTSHRREAGFFIMPWRGGFDRQGRLYDVGAVSTPQDEFTPALLRFTTELEPIDTLLLPDHRGEEYDLRAPDGRRLMTIPVPFTGAQQWQFDNEGYLWVGITDGYRLHRTTFGGDTVRIVERAFTPAPVAEADKDEALERFSRFAEIGGPLDPSRIPRTKPAFQTIVVDDADFLWIRAHVARGEPAAFDVFDPEGRYLGRVESDAEPALYPAPVVRGDRFYAVTTDEMGVQYVVRLRIQGR